MRCHLLCSLLALRAATALLVTPTAARLPVSASRAVGPAMIFGDIMKGVAKLQAGSYDEAEVKGALERQIQNRPCVMYSFSTCPFCKQTKECLDRLGAMYTCVELDQVEGGMATRAELANKVGRTSMPAVFAGGEYIGGCNDGGMGGVLTLNKAGSLKPLLQKAGSVAADRV
jgi:glutaredoxin 3